ncbi:MAG: thermonuclease family protein [Myxococcales bacterium]|nr:thermonuclease family protein [Myxococcales bacterium]
MRRRALPFALLLLVSAVAAPGVARQPKRGRTLTGVVRWVTDGDSLIVRPSNGRELRVRLSGIDAPELRQPFGPEARQFLRRRVWRRRVSLQIRGRDRYRRVVAVVRLGRLNLNRELVARGYAWCYRRYARDRELFRLEALARRARRGLWRQRKPTPPWVFRHRQGQTRRSPKRRRRRRRRR